MTNYEKIKTMNEEELVAVILQQDFCEACEYNVGGICHAVEEHEGEPLYNSCKTAALAWMGAPAREEA